MNARGAWIFAARALAVGLAALSLVTCGRAAPATVGARATTTTASAASAGEAVPDAAAASAASLWDEAQAGEAADLARLARREGSASLVAAAQDPARRLVVIRALAYADGLFAVAWLAEIARAGSDAEAQAALVSLVEIAARPRRAEDPDDVIELVAGCDRLLALAKDPTRPAARRIGAVDALRMFADRGAVSLADIPTDLDAHFP